MPQQHSCRAMFKYINLRILITMEYMFVKWDPVHEIN